MVHKNCGGEVYRVEYVCAIQLHCEKCKKVWELLDNLDDIEGMPKGRCILDSLGSSAKRR